MQSFTTTVLDENVALIKAATLFRSDFDKMSCPQICSSQMLQFDACEGLVHHRLDSQGEWEKTLEKKISVGS